MAKCLRCGAGGEWIQGNVKAEPADDDLATDLADVERERDAARYRWLRDVHERHVFVTRMVGGATIPRYAGHDLDALIDEARAASSAERRESP